MFIIVDSEFMVSYNYLSISRLFIIVDAEFMEQFRNHPMYNPDTQRFDHLGDNCFDGTWMAGVALNCTVARLKEMGNILTPNLYSPWFQGVWSSNIKLY